MNQALIRYKAKQVTYRILRWGHDRVAPGLRSFIGILFMVGGVFGFLPVLGFWMFPLGLGFVALDIPYTRRRIQRWMVKLKRELAAGQPTSSQ
ncbi:MAG: hypothetical protein O3A63_07540 [Proteobacteria bacterium]|nr:hypothetical protein [Pseudomonadota bacterium]